MFYFSIFLLGFIAATIGSIVGLGGGVFIVPVLLFLQPYVEQLAHITPQITVGTSLLVVSFTALGSTISYIKRKKVDLRAGIFFFSAMGPGSVIGAYLNKRMPEDVFQLTFGFIMLFILYLLVTNTRVRPKNIRWHVTKQWATNDGQLYEYGYHYYLAFLICLSIGVLQGLLGIGGGALLVPAMILLFWYPHHMAVATTMFVILLSSVAGSFSHIALNHIDWLLFAFLAPGALLGGQLGAAVASKMSSQKLAYLLKCVILMIAVFALTKGLT